MSDIAGHALGAASPQCLWGDLVDLGEPRSPLDKTILDNVDEDMGDLRIGHPGPLMSPKTKHIHALEKAARESAGLNAMKVCDADRRAKLAWDKALRALAQLDLLREMGISSSFPTGGTTGPVPSSVPSPSLTPHHPSPSFSSFLSSVGLPLKMADLQLEARILKEAEEERARGTNLHQPESLRAERAWVEDQVNWGHMA